MVNYTYKYSNEWAQLYDVIEGSTHQVIKSYMPQDEAKALCRHLNFGGGFDGFTPAFFLQKIPLSSVETV